MLSFEQRGPTMPLPKSVERQALAFSPDIESEAFVEMLGLD